MSFAISPAVSNDSLLSQLQRMHQQMDALRTEAMGGERGWSAAADAAGLSGEGEDELLAAPSGAESVGRFEVMLKQAFDNVNDLQNEAADLQTRFDLGDRSVTLADVMLSSQKSSISFEATLQIRNKMLEAYRTISQMTV